MLWTKKTASVGMMSASKALKAKVFTVDLSMKSRCTRLSCGCFWKHSPKVLCAWQIGISPGTAHHFFICVYLVLRLTVRLGKGDAGSLSSFKSLRDLNIEVSGNNHILDLAGPGFDTSFGTYSCDLGQVTYPACSSGVHKVHSKRLFWGLSEII